MLKFYDNPTVNKSEFIIFTETDLSVCKKREDFGTGRRENECERTKSRDTS